MEDGSYSTGQVATELGVSQARIRALCTAGKIQAVQTGGGQWRIGIPEFERIKQDGLPPLPRAPVDYKDEKREPPAPPRPEESLRVLNAIEETLVQKQRREALEHKVAILELEKRKAETQDFFDARAREEAERARQERERLRKEREQREAQKLREHWEVWAIRLLPHDAPAHVHERVRCEVRRQLSPEPLPNRASALRTIEAVVRTETATWVRQKEIDKLLKESREWLPYKARVYSSSDDPTWEKLARTATAQVIQAASTAPISELRADSRRAVERISEQFEHCTRCAEITKQHLASLTGVTPEEKRAAVRAVVTALTALPHDTQTSGMDEVARRTLAPFAVAIAARQRPAVDAPRKEAQAPAAPNPSPDIAPAVAAPRERETASSTAQHSATEQRVSRFLAGLDRYITEDIERHYDFTFRSSAHKQQFINSAEPKLRESLAQYMLERNNITTDEELRRRLRSSLQNYAQRGRF